MKEAPTLQKEYYVEPNFAYLAGPYDMTIKKNHEMIKAVSKDMEAGNIPYEIRTDDRGRFQVWRKGMILAIR